MPSFIPETIIDQIQSRCDIVDVISGYIPLKRAGRSFRALCPFHHEKTPSFMVSPKKQIFHCFGCGAGGNAFNFLMKYEKIEFPEAVKILAGKAGVQLPQMEEQYKSSPQSKDILKINELAAFFYQQTLVNFEPAKTARQYLKSRDIKDDIISLFKLGYAPDAEDRFIKYAKKFGISESSLSRAGLILESDKRAGFYDRFRNRIIFPIFNNRGKVVGFGGRTLDESRTKYINSPETELFNKGSNLYGFNFAEPYIRQDRSSIIVEGYIDLLMPFQFGIRNIVASLGTALTRDQIRLLKRFAQKAILIYDSDMAGEIATLRSLDLLIEEGLDVRIVDLPSGFDPDSFIRKEGAEKFKDRIKNAKSLFDYKLKVLSSKFNKEDIEGKARIAAEMLPSIKRIKNAILKSEYVKRLAEELHTSEESIIIELKKIKREKSETDFSSKYDTDSPMAFRPVLRPAEKILVGLMLEDAQMANSIKEKLSVEDFSNPNTKKIVTAVFELIKNNEAISPNRLLGYLSDEVVSQIVSEACAICEDLTDKDKCLTDCINRIAEDNFKSRLNQLQKDIRLAQVSKDDERLMELVSEYNKLIKERKT